MSHLVELPCWVATERQASFLRSCGFSHTRAIGLPVVYVPEPQPGREKDSLLVMPAHSLPTSYPAWTAWDYVEEIRDLRSVFGKITVCVNGHDWARGRWVHEFKDAGFEVIRGAGGPSSLERLASLFAQFEFVTTNGFGSLWAYASAFGAKVSVYGPFAEVTRDALKNVPYYVDNPDQLGPDVTAYGERYCREVFPEMFCRPADATERVEWGRAEVGWQNKQSPTDLRRLFGWTLPGLTRTRIDTVANRARAAVPQPVKMPLKELLEPSLRRSRRERRRLASLGTGAPGTTPLFGQAFEFAEAGAYLQTFDDCFVRQTYRFRVGSERPLIIDGHADIGLCVLYFKCLYPHSRILALEARSAACAILERNCRTYGLEDVEIVLGDPLADVVAAREAQLAAGARRDGEDESCALTELLAKAGGRYAQKIDLLKIRVDASTQKNFRRITALLGEVESVCVDYQCAADESQSVASLFEVLERAGFRIGVQSPDSARAQPLIAIPSGGAADSRLRILGYRI